MAPSPKNNQAPYLRLQKSWKDATGASFILLATWVRVLSLAMKTTHPFEKNMILHLAITAGKHPLYPHVHIRAKTAPALMRE